MAVLTGALRMTRTPEHKAVTTWAEKTCPSQDQCKPHLVGIRDSFQVCCLTWPDTRRGMQAHDGPIAPHASAGFATTAFEQLRQSPTSIRMQMRAVGRMHVHQHTRVISARRPGNARLSPAQMPSERRPRNATPGWPAGGAPTWQPRAPEHAAPIPNHCVSHAGLCAGRRTPNLKTLIPPHAQVTLEGVEVYDAVHYAVHILRSEAVALVNATVWGDPLIPASSGVVIDGSRRVFLGGCAISTADNAIGRKTTAGGCTCVGHVTILTGPQLPGCARAQHRIGGWATHRAAVRHMCAWCLLRWQLAMRPVERRSAAVAGHRSTRLLPGCYMHQLAAATHACVWHDTCACGELCSRMGLAVRRSREAGGVCAGGWGHAAVAQRRHRHRRGEPGSLLDARVPEPEHTGQPQARPPTTTHRPACPLMRAPRSAAFSAASPTLVQSRETHGGCHSVMSRGCWARTLGAIPSGCGGRSVSKGRASRSSSRRHARAGMRAALHLIRR